MVGVVDADAEDLPGIGDHGQELSDLERHPVFAGLDERRQAHVGPARDEGFEIGEPGPELRQKVHHAFAGHAAVGRLPILDEGRQFHLRSPLKGSCPEP